MNPSLFDCPDLPLARASDHEASHMAADDARRFAPTHRQLILQMVRDYPGLTYRELHDLLSHVSGAHPYEPVEVQRRLSDLKAYNYVHIPTHRVCRVSGRYSATYRITAQGLDALKEATK